MGQERCPAFLPWPWAGRQCLNRGLQTVNNAFGEASESAVNWMVVTEERAPEKEVWLEHRGTEVGGRWSRPSGVWLQSNPGPWVGPRDPSSSQEGRAGLGPIRGQHRQRGRATVLRARAREHAQTRGDGRPPGGPRGGGGDVLPPGVHRPEAQRRAGSGRAGRSTFAR